MRSFTRSCSLVPLLSEYTTCDSLASSRAELKKKLTGKYVGLERKNKLERHLNRISTKNHLVVRQQCWLWGWYATFVFSLKEKLPLGYHKAKSMHHNLHENNNIHESKLCSESLNVLSLLLNSCRQDNITLPVEILFICLY